MSYPIKQSTTTSPLLFLMVDDTDHVTGKTGLTPTVTISKNGATFAAPAGAVSPLANGWYQVAGNATDSATLGPLLLHATGTAADPTDIVFNVVANLEADTFSRIGAAGAGLTNIGTIATVTNLTTKTGFSLSTAGILAIWHQALSAVVTASSIGKLIKDEITAVRMATLTDWINGGRLDNLLDAIPTTPMRGTDGANTTTPVTGFTASDIAAIKTVTDALTEAAALKLAASAATIYSGTITGTPNSTTVADTSLTAITGGNDVLVGRVLLFTGGNAFLEGTLIESYVDSTGVMTVSTLAVTPANGDTFVIL